MSTQSEDLVADGKLTPDELDRLLDGLFVDGADTDDSALLSAARRIRSLAEEPIPTDVRNRHLTSIRHAAAEKMAVATPSTSGGFSGWLVGMRRRAAAVAAATGLAFTATGGGAVALAQDAGPDDLLYGVKLASEQVVLAVSSDDADLHLRFAERRIDELEAAPEHAEQLAPRAAEHLQNAQAHGAAADEAGAKAIESLTQVLANLPAEASENARIAVSRACAHIAARHQPDLEADCGYEGELPGNSGDAPGRNDAPGQNGNAPGDAPGRSGDAPRGGTDTSDSSDADDGARPDDAGPPEGVPAPDGDDAG